MADYQGQPIVELLGFLGKDFLPQRLVVPKITNANLLEYPPTSIDAYQIQPTASAYAHSRFVVEAF